MGPEIGGANGMCAFGVAADLDVPVVDADTMGRAFPRADMALPIIYGKAEAHPAVFSDARDNVQIIAVAENATRFEAMGRSICVELGSCAAMACNPLSAKVVQDYCCGQSISAAWLIGREIYLARQQKRNVAQAIVSGPANQLASSKLIQFIALECHRRPCLVCGKGCCC